MRPAHLGLVEGTAPDSPTPTIVILRVARWRSINPTSSMLLRAATCFPERPSSEWPRIDAMIVSILGRNAERIAPTMRLVRGSRRCLCCGR